MMTEPMTVTDVLDALRALGSPGTARVLRNHGAPDGVLGVKIGDMKPIQKRLKGQQATALGLWDSGLPDARYLAALVADGSKMTADQLDAWARSADWAQLAEYSVPWVATENAGHAALAARWIDDAEPRVRSVGWATWGQAVSFLPDDRFDLDLLGRLLDRVEATLHDEPDRVRYTMNGFVIAVGCYVPALHARALEVADALGEVRVNMGATACKVPPARATVEKVVSAGRLGRKRSNLKC